MPCASEKILMAVVSGHVSEIVNAINAFYDANSVLYPKAGVLLKVSHLFCCKKLALFMVTSIHSIQSIR